VKPIKAIVIVLTGDIPSSEMGKSATVTIEGRTYQGSLQVIAEYLEPAAPTATKVTLSAIGLKTV